MDPGAALRHDRLVARAQADRPPRDRLLERVAHAAVRHPQARVGRGAVRAARRAAGSLPEPLPERARVRRDRPSSAAACRWRASPATSRPRSTARRATRPGSARTPTAPAASCWRTRAASAPDAQRGPARRRSPGASADRVDYALEAAIFVTGAAVQWLRDGLGIIEAADETEELARSLDSNDGVYFVPALTGLGSPHWDPYARGTIVGLTRGNGRAHLARAALEAIAYQTVDAVRAMEAASGVRLEELKADGGAVGERLADAVPGRRARRAGGGAGDLRDDRARRGLPGRRGGRPVDRGATCAGCGARPRATSRACPADERETLLAEWQMAMDVTKSNRAG